MCMALQATIARYQHMLDGLPPLSNIIVTTTDDEDDQDLFDLLSLHHILSNASVEMNGLKCFHSAVTLTA